MHQGVGQLAIGGEQQQPRSVEIKPANGDPAPGLDLRQAFKNRTPTLWIFAAADLAGGLVIENAAGLLRRDRLQGLAVDADAVAFAYTVAQRGTLALNLHPALLDPAFHFAA